MTNQRLPLSVSFRSVCGALIDYEGWEGAIVKCRACKVWYKITHAGAQSHYDLAKEEFGVTIPMNTVTHQPRFTEPETRG